MSRIFFFMALFTTTVTFANAQGCSDAGFCTLGNLGQQHHDTSSYTKKLSLILPAGIGDGDVVVFTPGIQYEHQVNSHWLIQTKLTANYANGALGQVAGPGDIFLSGTYSFTPINAWVSSLMIGTKLPLNSGNLKVDGRSLPMQYQSSLGTTDIILGIQTSNRWFQFSAGWQQPLSGTNSNQFLPSDWPDQAAQVFPPSNNFKRRGDALLRGSYTYYFSDKMNLSGGLLGIYHLGEDQYTDENNIIQSIEGSDGLTLNVTLRGKWEVDKKWTLGFMAGAPLVVRNVRPDGLTRSFIFAPEISWKF